MTPNLQKFLERLTSRSVLTDEQQEAILGLPFLARQIEANQDFVELDEKTEHSCLVLEGLVGRFDENSLGDRQITALHIAGDMPDLQSLVQPTAPAALQALSASIILQIPHGALRALTRAHPAISEAFWRDNLVDSTISTQWIANLGRRNAPSRIAHLLCEMAYRYDAVSQDGKLQFKLPMTQSQIANATGMTMIHANRTLKKLAAIGTTLCSGIVVIKNLDALTDLGDFDEDYLQRNVSPIECHCIAP